MNGENGRVGKMLLSQLQEILSRIRGCTFASIDAETKVAGLRKVVKNERVILFTNQKTSGYENLVKRRLERLGRDPDSFVLGQLPWGERVPGTPLIKHRGFYYLQTVLIERGSEDYFVGTRPVDKRMLPSFGIKPRQLNQGLPTEYQVQCHCYALENITGIRLMNEDLVDGLAPRPRKKLSVRFK